MPVSPSCIWNSLFSTSDQAASEESGTNTQDEPAIPENEKPIADCNNHESSKSNGAINLGTRASTDEDGFSSSVVDEKPNEDGLASSVVNEKPNEDGLASAVAVEQPIEGGIVSAEAVEQPIEGGIASTAEVEQPDGGDLDSTDADQQPNEDKNKKLTSVKLEIFDAMTTILGVLIPLTAVGFGYENMGECPANLYLPYMVFIIGLVSLFIVGYAVVKTSNDNFNGLQQNERMVVELSFRCFVCLWFCELVSFFFTEVSFDSSADNYCDYSFHSSTIFMNIFAALALVIGSALLYDFDVARTHHLDRRATKTPREAHEWMTFESSDSE